MCNNECKCRQTEPVRRIPFNLERALAGDPVITRDGSDVLDLTYFKNITDSDMKLRGILNGALEAWTIKGEYFSQRNGGYLNKSFFDIFMKPKPPKKLWIAVSKRTWACDSYNHPTSNAKPYERLKLYQNDPNYVIIPIELPED